MQRKGHDGVCGGQCVGVIMDDPKRDTIIEKDNYDVGVCVFYLCHQSLFNDEIAVRPYFAWFTPSNEQDHRVIERILC